MHICVAVGALRKCVEKDSCWLSCVAMVGQYLALKKKKSFQRFLENTPGFIPHKLNNIKIIRQSNCGIRDPQEFLHRFNYYTCNYITELAD